MNNIKHGPNIFLPWVREPMRILLINLSRGGFCYLLFTDSIFSHFFAVCKQQMVAFVSSNTKM